MEIVKGIEKFIEKPDASRNEIIREMRRQGIIGHSQKIIPAYQRTAKAAASEASIIIEGESGTGKEIFAQTLHNLGKRPDGPMVKLNCAEIPDNLLESELFGYEKGAFTGAVKKKIGKFELADMGTIFLDEISEMALSLQSKLLRVIENKTVTRVGGLENVPVNVRIISATNRNLWQQVKEGKFREDLFYRLNVIYLHLPALRERREDIPLLTNHFIKKYTRIENTPIESIDESIIRLFISLNWSGNVRQLENVIHHAIIMSTGGTLRIFDLPENIYSSLSDGAGQPVDNGYIKKDDVIITNSDIYEIERSQILNVLQRSHWKISEAAESLGIHRNTLTQKMKRYKIK